MSYQQIIRNSSLRFSLRIIAVQLAKRWFECAKIKYDIVGDVFECDELEIENDFVEYLSNAIESLVHDSSREKKSIQGWSFGFICGHIQAALHLKWSNQYLIEPSKEFKDLMKIKTIIEALRIDNDLSQKIDIIYNYFIAHKTQITTEEEILPNNVISMIRRGNLHNTTSERHTKEFNEYFNNLLLTNYKSLIRAYGFICCPDLTEYLDEIEVMSIVGKEHFA